MVWFHRLPAGDVATDFRTQTYLGQPVLTWFQSGGQGAHGGPAGSAGPVGPNGPSGTDYIYNDRYRQVATVRAGHGDATNFHEFLITPWNTALILADTVTTANLTAIGGPADQLVIDGWGALPYISEFSPAGKLLFNAKLPAGVSSYRAYLLPWPPAGRIMKS